MRRILCLTIAFVFTAFIVNGQDSKEASSSAGPQISFKTTTHDFGVIEEGPQASYEFEFTNTGDEPLVLKNVKASCGCTTPYWPKEPIMPGESGKIKAVYNTKGRPGNFTKIITVTTNANPATVQLTIKGKVLKEDPNEGIPQKKPSVISAPSFE